MNSKRYLVTGGTGFIGSALVRHLVGVGHRVRVLDDDSRGSNTRLADLRNDIEFIRGDVRDAEAVERAISGVDSVCHLAFVNGTEFFYSKPELVLDVGVKGIINVLDACKKMGVRELVLASSSEVYQTPPVVPTDELVPLSIPDPLNPRYCYAAGKIISEIMTINYGRRFFDRVLIFRPHNVYGPDMGWEHVIPQFVVRIHDLLGGTDPIHFPIQGSGQETRAFVYIEDFIAGLGRVIEQGEHLGIYHIGTTDEVTIEHLAQLVATHFKREIRVITGKSQPGGTPRRCPDITKLAGLGYRPRCTLAEGLAITAQWYSEHAHQRPRQDP